MKILIVEDDVINQQLILNQLALLGYRADCADNGSEALTMLSRKSYDIVFMDCQMPVMDGYEATQELRRREESALQQRTTVIALTTYALPEERDKCLQSGMDDYLSKPINLRDLQASLQRWASKSVNHDVPVDIKRLREITRGKIEVQQRLLETFLEAATEDLKVLKDAIASGDYSTIEQKAHRLKGSSANLGMPTISAIAATIEQQAGDKNLSQTAELFVDLERNFSQVQAFIKSYFYKKNMC
ncbi:MAG: response regulator [Oscillatoriaceae bacterium SKW80]|nr:response regulator [Oscillatoriaceae bacterium SKYG93]MCX8119710.1 response regulator [Oscillatoriaceae bacterium SKW80]MDW8452413.1 response regulator [Oscillatoriaceae cyanobacterium SKYGB_i_bin93]HIK27614.1 response regulator [Oscillatoriaceae cyanobacterium M7585_C2015_266]